MVCVGVATICPKYICSQGDNLALSGDTGLWCVYTLSIFVNQMRSTCYESLT